jgi:DNA-binding transcriptional MerR regulator
VRTVGEVARLAGVTVRTLHHYDEIGLVRPSGRTDAGYRVYDEHDLEQLHTVLLYRELGFPLDRIRALMTDPDFDHGAALRDQRGLLDQQAQRLRRMIHAVDELIEARERGAVMSDEAMFEVFGKQHREYQAEAEQTWGDTDAWATSRERTARYTQADWEELKTESAAIMNRIAEVYRSGASAASSEAMDAVDAHRLQIDRRFYACTPQMHVQLGEMYVGDPRFTATYEAIAPGLAAWVRDAINANAERATL